MQTQMLLQAQRRRRSLLLNSEYRKVCPRYQSTLQRSKAFVANPARRPIRAFPTKYHEDRLP
jgi:hypothetical protein